MQECGCRKVLLTSLSSWIPWPLILSLSLMNKCILIRMILTLLTYCNQSNLILFYVWFVLLVSNIFFLPFYIRLSIIPLILQKPLPPLHVDPTSSLLWLRIWSLPKPLSLSLIPLYLSSLDHCFPLSQCTHVHTHVHTHTHTVSGSSGRSLKSYMWVCLLWSEPSKFPFGSSVTDFLLWRTVFTQVCVYAHACGHVNYSIISDTEPL